MKRLLTFFVAISGVISAHAIGFTDLTGLRWELPPDREKRRTSAEVEAVCQNFLINGRPSRVPTAREITNVRDSRNNETLYQQLVELRKAYAPPHYLMFATTSAGGAEPRSMGLENGSLDIYMGPDQLSWAICVGGPSKPETAKASPSNVSPGRFYIRLSKELYELDDKRVALNKSAPGSAEARRVGAEYAALQAAATRKMNDFRLQLERADPNSKDARSAAAIYHGMLLDAAKIDWGTKPAVSKDVVAAAEREWQAQVRENNPDAASAERDYRALAKLADSTNTKSTKVGSDPTLTRVYREPKGKPAAESLSSQPSSSSSSSGSGSGSGVTTIICFRGTVPGPNQRCGTNKGSDAPGQGVSR